MARLLDTFVSEPRRCAYLPVQTASLEYRVMLDVSPAELDDYLARGWRRFGVAYFRPACPACSECVPLRIPLERFTPSRNQRRARNRGRDLHLVVGVPRIDDERLRLYRAWHEMQGSVRGWGQEPMDAERYFHEFAFPHPSVREFAYYDLKPEGGGPKRLVAVSIVDETPLALSAVYTYHHPAYRRISLGTYSILRQIEAARAAKKRWLYLGYRVLGCRSSEYKANFTPHELLEGWPDHLETPRWKLVEGGEVAVEDTRQTVTAP